MLVFLELSRAMIRLMEMMDYNKTYLYALLGKIGVGGFFSRFHTPVHFPITPFQTWRVLNVSLLP